MRGSFGPFRIAAHVRVSNRDTRAAVRDLANFEYSCLLSDAEGQDKN